MRNIFASMSGCPEEEKIQSAYKKMMEKNHRLQQKTELSLQKNRKQLETLRLEIAKVLAGESIYTEDDISVALNTVKAKIDEDEKLLQKLKDEDSQKKAISDGGFPHIISSRTGQRSLMMRRLK